MTAGRERRTTIKHADIIQTKEPALENIHPICIFSIYPPREIKQKFLEDALQKNRVTDAAPAFFDLVDAPRGPRVNGRIHVAEGPFVSRQLAVRMHIPLAQHQD